MEKPQARPDAPPEVLDAVGKEYEQSLIVPDRKPSVQWMLMPVGLIGAGKTTVVKPLAEQLCLVRLSTDDVRKLLRERGYSYEGCRDIIFALGQKYLGLGHSLALDANTGSVSGLAYNARAVEKFPKVRQLFIKVDPPDAFIIEKLRNYPHTWLFKSGEDAVASFYKNKADFAFPDLPYVYTFDTSRPDLSEQIGECARALEEALALPSALTPPK